MNGSNGTPNNGQKIKIEYCPECGDVVYCEQFNVHCNKNGVCEACCEIIEGLNRLIEEEKRYGRYYNQHD